MTTVLPSTSNGMVFVRSAQRFSFTSASSSAPRFASASIMNSAASATDGELAMPVVISGIFRLFSDGMSTASKPTPMRVTTRMSPDEFSSFSPNGVPPSATACTGACCFSSVLKSADEMAFGKLRISTSLRSFRSAIPVAEKVSVTSTFFLFVAAVAIAFPRKKPSSQSGPLG